MKEPIIAFVGTIAIIAALTGLIIFSKEFVIAIAPVIGRDWATAVGVMMVLGLPAGITAALIWHIIK